MNLVNNKVKVHKFIVINNLYFLIIHIISLKPSVKLFYIIISFVG